MRSKLKISGDLCYILSLKRVLKHPLNEQHGVSILHKKDYAV